MSEKQKILTAVLVTAVVSVCAANFVNSVKRYAPADSGIKNLSNKTAVINNYLKNNYLYDYDEKAMNDAAISAYIEALDEPYTHYYNAEEFERYVSDVEDSYVGIGVVVGVNDNNEIEVVAPFENSPAYEAGVLPGDILLAVDGTEYSGDEMNDAVSHIKSGKKGTTVAVTFRRGEEKLDFTIERREVSMESVSSEMLEDNIGYVHISAFNAQDINGGTQDTYTEFAEEVEKLESEGMERMIIDLRDNPGGVVDVVCNIADMLLPEGTITYMEYKDGSKDVFSSDKNELDIPMAVLINGYSASASEVLTGALKDYDKAVIVGEKSYGKGIVQSVYPFSDGSGMSMTIAQYFSPKGVCIHDIGIEPDVVVEPDEEYKDYYASSIPHEEDVQLQKAIEEVKKR